MTPIGHFTVGGITAGATGLLRTRETLGFCAYYLLFLILMGTFAHFFEAGKWVMTFYDNFGLVPFYILALFWFRAEPRKQYVVAMLFGTLILAGNTHNIDKLYLLFRPELPSGVWRPHNLLHTPLIGIVYSLIVTPIVVLVFKNSNWKMIFYSISVGYLLHIFSDTVIYDYPIYWLWPFSDHGLSLVSAFQRPDLSSSWLGNPWLVAGWPSKFNPDGWILYMGEIVTSLVFIVFYCGVMLFKYLAGRTGFSFKAEKYSSKTFPYPNSDMVSDSAKVNADKNSIMESGVFNEWSGESLPKG